MRLGRTRGGSEHAAEGGPHKQIQGVWGRVKLCGDSGGMGAAAVVCVVLSLVLVSPGLWPAPSCETLVSTAVDIQTWGIHQPGGDIPVKQVYAGVSFERDLSARPCVRVKAYLPLAWSKYQDATITGPGDTGVRAVWRARSRRFSAVVGFDLPTGRTHLSLEQYKVATRALPSRLLDLELKRVGEGFDIVVGGSAARTVARNTVVGAALMLRSKGSYVAYEAEDEGSVRISPSEEVLLGLTLVSREHQEDPLWRFRAGIGFLYTGRVSIEPDEVPSFEIDPGPEVSLHASYYRWLKEGRWLDFWIRGLLRDESSVHGRPGLAPTEILGISVKRGVGIGFAYTRPFYGDFKMGLEEMIFNGAKESGSGNSITWILIGWSREIDRYTSVEAGLRFGFGSTAWGDPFDTSTWHSVRISGSCIRVSATRRFL